MRGNGSGVGLVLRRSMNERKMKLVGHIMQTYRTEKRLIHGACGRQAAKRQTGKYLASGYGIFAKCR